MLILTDCENRIADWVGRVSPTGRECGGQGPSSVSSVDLNLFQDLLGEGRRLQAFSASPTIQFGGWDVLVVVERARESQFDRLVAAVREGLALPDSVVCLALEGEGFHGIRRRAWAAHRGNIHFSSLHRVGRTTRQIGHGFSMLPTLAVLDAIDELSGGRVMARIKWVNDVVIGGAKVAGAITATRIQGDTIEHAMLGIGFNVETCPPLPPSPSVPEATCLRRLPELAEVQFCPAATALLRACWSRVQYLKECGFRPMLSDYRARSACLGRPVSIWPDSEFTSGIEKHHPIAAGRLIAIYDDLSLQIQGVEQPVYTGRLRMETAADVTAGGN